MVLKNILFRVPWTARRSNQSTLRKINLEYSLEGLMLKLKVQYFGHLVHRADSLEKTLMLGTIEGGFPLGLTSLISLQSRGLSRVFSSSTVSKASILWLSAFFMVQLSHLYMTTGKTIALTIQWVLTQNQTKNYKTKPQTNKNPNAY